MAAVVEVPTVAPQREEAALLLGKKVLVRLVEGAGSKLHATAHAAALATLQRAGLTRLPAELTALYCAMTDDRKFARDVGAHPGIAQGSGLQTGDSRPGGPLS